MSTNLTPDNEALLREAVRSGSFASESEALDAALGLLQRKLEVDAQLAEGLDSGDAREVDADFWQGKRDDLSNSSSGRAES